jgi:hypothetical protein
MRARDRRKCSLAAHQMLSKSFFFYPCILRKVPLLGLIYQLVRDPARVNNKRESINVSERQSIHIENRSYGQTSFVCIQLCSDLHLRHYYNVAKLLSACNQLLRGRSSCREMCTTRAFRLMPFGRRHDTPSIVYFGFAAIPSPRGTHEGTSSGR